MVPCHRKAYILTLEKKTPPLLWDVLSNLISWFDKWEKALPLIWSQMTSGKLSEVGIGRISTGGEESDFWHLKNKNMWQFKWHPEMSTEHDLPKKCLWHLKPEPSNKTCDRSMWHPVLVVAALNWGLMERGLMKRNVTWLAMSLEDSPDRSKISNPPPPPLHSWAQITDLMTRDSQLFGAVRSSEEMI